jgi:osmotically-inducible protein OsmY
MLRILLTLASSILAFGAVVPKQAPANDAVVEAAIRAKFTKSKINEEHFKVTVRSGVALLEGKTSIPQRKGVATRLAKTGGAREVVNKIEVSEAARKQMTDRLQKARDRKAAALKSAAPTNTLAAKPAAPIANAGASTTPEPAPLRRMQLKP